MKAGWLSTSGLLCGLALANGNAAAQTAEEAAYRGMVQEYCGECHNFEDYAGGLDLASIVNAPFGEHAAEWERAIRRLRAGVMPPPDHERPPRDKYLALTQWLEAKIDAQAGANPGSIMLHRLNRTEYANAVRDLLGLEIDVSTLLPADTSARGFDNIAGSLTLSPTLLEAYATAAARVSRMAVGFWRSPAEVSYLAPGDASQNYQLEGMPLGTRGGMAVNHNFLADGLYTFHIQNFGVGAFIPGEQLELSVDGERVEVFKYEGVGLNTGMGGDRDGSLEVTVPVKAGTRLVGATFIATNYRPGLGTIREYDRKSIENEKMPQVQYPPVIGLLKILGPFEPTRPEDSVSMNKIMTCRPASQDQFESCARQILSTLATRAYRRPAQATDLDVLLPFFRQGVGQEGVFADGIELALRRLLADPEFLVRVEQEPAQVAVGQAYRISDLELASRLSFFLWSSIPDDELLNLAVQDQLHQPAVLEQQVRRMLADPRAEALVSNFGQQYLYLRNLPTTSPDGIYYPNWDDELRHAFQRETELFWASIIREDRSVLDLIDANYTFLNERLAKHYGIPNIYGAQFRRVELTPEFDNRRGLLGKGSFLTTTFSENFRTSPVKRGIWVLENMLGTVPPEPPPNVPALEETKDGAVAIRTLRDQLTQHRVNPPCSTCHSIMDPIGFALEGFDADGSWRTREGHPRKGTGFSVALDTQVQLWDGTPANGVADLRNNLKYYSPQFARFMTEKLLSYAMGRGVEYFDMPVVRGIVQAAESSNYRFSDLLLNIVRSDPFQMRVKEGTEPVLVGQRSN